MTGIGSHAQSLYSRDKHHLLVRSYQTKYNLLNKCATALCQGRRACTYRNNYMLMTGAFNLNPVTPDGRYFVVKEQLWRCSNPALNEDERQRLVKDLMAARRSVKAAKASGDPDEMTAARSAVQAAKVALGERGPVWWKDGAPDFNRHKVVNTPYAPWYRSLGDVTS